MNELATLNLLSRRLRLPREWLRQQAAAGRIPCLKVGRRRIFNVKAVERAINQMASRAEEPNEP